MYIIGCITHLFTAWIALTAHSSLFSYMLLLVWAAVGVLGPWLFLRAQREKRELRGPWDYDDSGEKGANNI
jgi:hypothetical protein